MIQLGLPSWQDITAVVTAFALYKCLAYINRKSVLDDLKGPPGGGFVEGQFANWVNTTYQMAEGTIAHLVLGHLGLMFDIKHGLDYMQGLSDEYGDVVRVKGLGVCQTLITVWIG